MLKDSELLEQEVKNSCETQFVSAFSMYVEDKQSSMKSANPNLSFLEIIALLQEEWANEDNS